MLKVKDTAWNELSVPGSQLFVGKDLEGADEYLSQCCNLSRTLLELDPTTNLHLHVSRFSIYFIYHNFRGVYFSFCSPPPSPGGGQKYEFLLGWGKYDFYYEKTGGKRGKRRNFYCTWVKKYDFWKREGAKNINYFDYIHPCIILSFNLISKEARKM